MLLHCRPKLVVYGIRVGDTLDLGSKDRHDIIAIERQGGRPFLVYDEYGNVTSSDVKDSLKTRGSVRVLIAPRPLMELIGLVIDVFHTDPHGAMNLDARLFPGIGRPNTGG